MELINVKYSDPVHGEVHVVVLSPFGSGGSSFHVSVNKYSKGHIVRYNTGWFSYVELGILSQDDIDAILDAIDQIEPSV